MSWQKTLVRSLKRNEETVPKIPMDTMDTMDRNTQNSNSVHIVHSVQAQQTRLTDAQVDECYSWPAVWQKVFCALMDTYEQYHHIHRAEVLAYDQTKFAMSILETRH